VLTPQKLKEWRVERGFNQTMLGTIIKRDQYSVSNYENGKTPIPEHVEFVLEKWEKENG
jgi:predicted transcriptional regulator